MTTESETEIVVIDCDFLKLHTHVFPGDWNLGPDDVSWNTDPRWVPIHYTYFDKDLNVVYHTGSFLCQEEALDSFTTVRDMGLGVPMYLSEKKEGQEHGVILPWQYIADTDTLHPMKAKS